MDNSFGSRIRHTSYSIVSVRQNAPEHKNFEPVPVSSDTNRMQRTANENVRRNHLSSSHTIIGIGNIQDDDTALKATRTSLRSCSRSLRDFSLERPPSIVPSIPSIGSICICICCWLLLVSRHPNTRSYIQSVLSYFTATPLPLDSTRHLPL